MEKTNVLWIMGYTLLVLMMVLVAACGDGNNNLNPDGGDSNVEADGGHDGDAGNETDGDIGETDGGDGGDLCTFSPNDWMASITVEAGRKGVLTLNYEGATYNGASLTTPVAAKKTIFVVTAAFGINVPLPGGGEYAYIPGETSGLEYAALDAEKPMAMTEGGCLPNEITVPCDSGECYTLTLPERFGTVLFFDQDKGDWVIPQASAGLTSELTLSGTVAKFRHLSPYYIINRRPTVQAAITVQDDGRVVVDFTGSAANGSTESFAFSDFILRDGTASIQLIAGATPLQFVSKDPLSPGEYSLTAEARGRNFAAGTFEQDKGDESGLTASVPDPCAQVDCHNGTCKGGTCTCNEGWALPSCATCANGYHAEGQECKLDQVCQANSCNGHGTCSIVGGLISCQCSVEYALPTCNTCASGYQDRDGDGVCSADCSTANLNCGHGACSDITGKALCVCDTGYALPSCSTCAEGYQDKDGNGTCNPDCNMANLNCQANAHCDDSSGTALCVCDTDFQDNDHNGTCLEACKADYCTHGTCDDSSGTRTCTCSTGWALPTCSSCAQNFTGSDCHRDWCADNACQNGGTCSSEQCHCVNGFSGVHCEIAPDPCAGVNCNGHGNCVSGTCNCNTGYNPSTSCGSCASGYVGYPTCTADLCSPDPCNGHSTACNPLTGVCTCASNYKGAACNQCADGYINYPSCTADPCYGVDCNGHGACSGGTCSCTGGWTGTNCQNPPLPTVKITGLDCSGPPDPGWCAASGHTYPLTFTSTNASTFTASQTLNCGLDGVFTPATGNVTLSPMTISYTTAMCSGPITLKVEVCNLTGCASDTLDVDTY